MSFATMNSSTFSVLRGNESSLRSFRGGPSEVSFGHGPDMAPASPTEPRQRVVIERDPVLLGSGHGRHPAIGSADGPAVGPGRSAHQQQQQQQQQGHPPPPAGGGRFDASFSPADLPMSRSAARYQHAVGQQSAAIREDYEEAHGVATAVPPARPIRLTEDEPSGEFGIDGMGQSSMELLKAAFQSSTDWDVSTNQLQIPPQHTPPSDPHQHQKRQHR
jgi:hypothetical protein